MGTVRVSRASDRSRSTLWPNCRIRRFSTKWHTFSLGHTAEADFADIEMTPRNLREVEAESVALLCCEALNLEGADFCRAYIQNWLCPAIGYNGDGIPEKSAQKIFRAADQILRAGRPTVEGQAA